MVEDVDQREKLEKIREEISPPKKQSEKQS